jgi:hypothetical protein
MKPIVRILALSILAVFALQSTKSQSIPQWMNHCLQLDDQQLQNLGINTSKHCLSFTSQLPDGRILEFKVNRKGIFINSISEPRKNSFVSIGRSQNNCSACPVLICDEKGTKYFSGDPCESNCKYIPIRVKLRFRPASCSDDLIFVLIYNRGLESGLENVDNKESYLLEKKGL